MLDSGAQLSMIHKACAARLGLQKQPCEVTVNGINGSRHLQTATVDLQIQIKDSSYMSIKMLMMPKLTELLPSERVPTTTCRMLKSVQLADPNFDKPGHVDIILGSDVFEDLVLDGKLDEVCD